MRTNKILLCLLFICCFTAFGMAQKITGIVVDKTTKESIPGANIIVVGKSGVGATTDIDGKFTIDIPQGVTEISVSFVGYKAQKVSLESGRTDYQIEMEAESTMLEGAVVVGFGTQKKANLTGAIAVVNVDDLKGTPAQNVDQALQGRVAGLNISYRNGDLGASPKVQVRGMGSINGSSGSPLVLVDNVETDDLRVVNPEDIESMTLLKDAASSSIYGTRAAFGVLLITTKSGKKNQKSIVSYSNNFGWNTITTLPDFPHDPVADLQGGILANARNQNNNPELFGMRFDKLISGISNWQQKYANNRTSNEMVLGEDWEIEGGGISGQPYFYRIWDPKDVMFKKWSAQQTHNLQVSGGSEKIAYFTSLGYNSTDGIWKPATDRIRRINANANINASVTSWLNMNLRYQSSFSKQEQPFPYQDYFYYMWRWGAYFPYGTYKGVNFRTPNGFMENANDWTKNYNMQRINASLAATITQDLKLNVDYAYSVNNGLEKYPGGSVYLWDFWSAMDLSKGPTNLTSPSADYVRYMSSKESQQMFNIYGVYTKTLNEVHNFKVTAGFNSESGSYIDHYSRRNLLLDKDMAELKLTSGDADARVINDPNNWSTAGFIARLNYDYKGKWLLEVNARYDGSSNFPRKDQWAFFPSASAAYRITSESFMDFSKPILNELKIRASYGHVGNQDIGQYVFIPTMNSGTANWIEGSTRVPYTANPRAVSPSLSWERVQSVNIGVDARLINNLFNITFDWFQRDTKDLVANSKELPATFGAAVPRTNAGNLQSKGWELTLGYNQSFGKDLTIYATFILSDYTNTITKWDNAAKTLDKNYEGKVMGEIWGFETDRYFTKDDDMNTVPKQDKLSSSANFKYGPGDIKYKDLDESGTIDGGDGTLGNHGDLKVIGNSTPRYNYGFTAGMNFKGFDFEAFFQGVGQRKLWGWGDMAIPYYRGADLLLDHQLDYWTETNTNAKYPRLFTSSNAGNVAGLAKEHGGNNFYPQTKYLLNMAYLRLRNLTFGYTLPKALTQRAYIEKLRVYFSAQNLLTFSNVGIPIDPETNFNTDAYSGTDFLGRSYPYTKTLSFGVQIVF